MSSVYLHNKTTHAQLSSSSHPFPRQTGCPPVLGLRAKKATRHPHHLLTLIQMIPSTLKEGGITIMNQTMLNLVVGSIARRMHQMPAIPLEMTMTSMGTTNMVRILIFCLFSFFQHSFCSHPSIALQDTDSDPEVYGQRPAPSSESLGPPPGSRMGYSDSSTPTFMEYGGPAGAREAYPAWSAERQIPLSKEEIEDIFLDLTQKFGFQRDSMRNMVRYLIFPLLLLFFSFPSIYLIMLTKKYSLTFLCSSSTAEHLGCPRTKP